jgi:hypothetical protein
MPVREQRRLDLQVAQRPVLRSVRWSVGGAADHRQGLGIREVDGTVRPFMRPRLSLIVLPLALLLGGCPHAPTTPAAPPGAPSDPPERAALKGPVAALSVKSEELLRAQDELVWKHWIEGTPATDTTYAGTEAWLTPRRWPRGTAARAHPGRQGAARAHPPPRVPRRGVDGTTDFDLSDGVASLEQSLTFPVAGTDRMYRNLESLLANERSASDGASCTRRNARGQEGRGLIVQRTAKNAEPRPARPPTGPVDCPAAEADPRSSVRWPPRCLCRPRSRGRRRWPVSPSVSSSFPRTGSAGRTCRGWSVYRGWRRASHARRSSTAHGRRSPRCSSTPWR